MAPHDVVHLLLVIDVLRLHLVEDVLARMLQRLAHPRAAPSLRRDLLLKLRRRHPFVVEPLRVVELLRERRQAEVVPVTERPQLRAFALHALHRVLHLAVRILRHALQDPLRLAPFHALRLRDELHHRRVRQLGLPIPIRWLHATSAILIRQLRLA